MRGARRGAEASALSAVAVVAVRKKPRGVWSWREGLVARTWRRIDRVTAAVSSVILVCRFCYLGASETLQSQMFAARYEVDLDCDVRSCYEAAIREAVINP